MLVPAAIQKCRCCRRPSARTQVLPRRTSRECFRSRNAHSALTGDLRAQTARRPCQTRFPATDVAPRKCESCMRQSHSRNDCHRAAEQIRRGSNRRSRCSQSVRATRPTRDGRSHKVRSGTIRPTPIRSQRQTRRRIQRTRHKLAPTTDDSTDTISGPGHQPHAPLYSNQRP